MDNTEIADEEMALAIFHQEIWDSEFTAYNKDMYDKELALSLSLSTYTSNYNEKIPYFQSNTNNNLCNPNISNINFNEQYTPCKKYSNLAAVILFPSGNDPMFSLDDIDLQKRIEYMARAYHVYLKRVFILDEAIDIVINIKKKYKIGHLELGGHGSPTSLSWPMHILKVGYDKEKLSLLFSLLEFDAAIMTLSCYNGKNIKGDNFLDYLAKIAKGHRVIGTSCANGKHLRLKISSASPFIIEYTKGNTNVTVIKQFS